MIRAARSILDCVILEILTTLMAEVRAIMNGLSSLCLLTPKSPVIIRKLELPHLYLMTLGKESFLRKNGLNLAKTFWRRWCREKLSMLQSRQKWIDKGQTSRRGM